MGSSVFVSLGNPQRLYVESWNRGLHFWEKKRVQAEEQYSGMLGHGREIKQKILSKTFLTRLQFPLVWKQIPSLDHFSGLIIIYKTAHIKQRQNSLTDGICWSNITR